MNKLKELHLSGKAKTGLVILLLILLTSVLAPVLAPYDPLVSNLSEALQKPSAAHLLGTDNIGRDTLSRVLYGGRQSILLALVATVLSMLLGLHWDFSRDISAAGSTGSSRRSPAFSRDFPA